MSEEILDTKLDQVEIKQTRQFCIVNVSRD